VNGDIKLDQKHIIYLINIFKDLHTLNMLKERGRKRKLNFVYT
jgi:hypothetical protein